MAPATPLFELPMDRLEGCFIQLSAPKGSGTVHRPFVESRPRTFAVTMPRTRATITGFQPELAGTNLHKIAGGGKLTFNVKAVGRVIPIARIRDSPSQFGL